VGGRVQFQKGARGGKKKQGTQGGLKTQMARELKNSSYGVIESGKPAHISQNHISVRGNQENRPEHDRKNCTRGGAKGEMIRRLKVKSGWEERGDGG